MSNESQHDLVTVAVPQDSEELAFAQALLEEAGIPCSVRNADLQDLVGVGRIGGGSQTLGAIEVQVRRGQAERAREVLEGAWSEEALPLEEIEPARRERDDAATPAEIEANRLAKVSMAWSILWFVAGIGSALAIYNALKALQIPGAPRGARVKAGFGLFLGLAGLTYWAVYIWLTRREFGH